MQRKLGSVDIHAIAFREGEWWSAQCLEYDIAVQAKSVAALQREIERVLTAYVVLAQKEKRSPFEGLDPAPKKYREMYKRAQREVTSSPIPRAESSDVRPIIPHLRIAEERAGTGA
jgi:hypothetical protein